MRKTSIQESIIPELSKERPAKMKSGKKTFRSITNEHVCLAMTTHLRSLSSIDDNEEVISYFKVPEGIEVKIGEIKND